MKKGRGPLNDPRPFAFKATERQYPKYQFLLSL